MQGHRHVEERHWKALIESLLDPGIFRLHCFRRQGRLSIRMRALLGELRIG